MAHRLDGVETLDERAARSDAHDGDGVGHRDHHPEALRHEGDDDGGGARGLDQRKLAVDVVERADDGDREQHNGGRGGPERVADLALEGRALGVELARLRRDAVGHALAADALASVQGAAGHAEAAGEEVVADALGDEVGLAGEERLIDRAALLGEDGAIDLHLVAGLDEGTSPSTTSSAGTCCSAPSRMTVALERARTAMRSSWRLARTSWKTPTATLPTTRPAVKRASM